MDWYEKFIKPIWGSYKIWGFILIAVLLLGVLWFASAVLGVGVGEYFNGLLGVE